MKDYPYIIIGASIAGLSAAKAIRQKDPLTKICILSKEPGSPYKRTKLSKSFHHKPTLKDFALNPQSWYEEQNITLMTDSEVLEISPKEKSLILNNQQCLGYGELLLATGAEAKSLDIPGQENLLFLRTKQDLIKIQNELIKAKTIVIVGSGVEAMEMANQIAPLKKDLYMLSKDAQPMERWLDEKLRDILMNDLKKNNIHVSYEDQLLQVIKAKQGYTLKCASGNLQADLVLASIGIQGSSCLAKDLGIYGQQGIPVNPFMETEIPHIFAAGDVTELPSDYPWGLWHSAELQGYTAGLNMSGIRTSLEKKSFRLKTEVFGNFFFSQNYAQSKDTYPSKTIIDRDNCYLRVFHDRNYLKGALMMNFKGIGKKLQQYIQEEISLKSLYSFLESLELTESES